MKTITAIIARRVIDMKNTVKIIAAILAFTMFTSCGQLEDTSKAETKATSATATTTTVGRGSPHLKMQPHLPQRQVLQPQPRHKLLQLRLLQLKR